VLEGLVDLSVLDFATIEMAPLLHLPRTPEEVIPKLAQIEGVMEHRNIVRLVGTVT
jgi:hypothetical protein